MPHRFHPLLDQVRNAIGTAGRGGAHRLLPTLGSRLLPTLGSRRLRRGSAAVALLAVLALATLAGTGQRAGAPDAADRAGAAGLALPDRAAAAQAPSRSLPRVQPEAPAAPRPQAAAPSVSPPPPPPPPEPEPEPEPAPAPEPEPEPEPEPVAAEFPAPIGGLTERQMEHAATIVRVGREDGLPDHAHVVAIATALQESYLRVLASPVVPESANYPHDDSTVDHDSVGLFQQRPSQGWGTVAQCMDPEYAARKFYEVLQQVPGWQNLPVTVAAQAVQQSAFPDHYAKHEPLARQLVDVLT